MNAGHQLSDLCVCVRVFPLSNRSYLGWKNRRERERDIQIVLHPQYVFELVAMQQDWESVEEGDGKMGTVSERKEAQEERKGAP